MKYCYCSLCIQSALCVFNFNIGPFTFVSGEPSCIILWKFVIKQRLLASYTTLCMHGPYDCKISTVSLTRNFQLLASYFPSHVYTDTVIVYAYRFYLCVMLFVICVVFASVGGLYFFLRTTLNALIKCIRVVLLISYKFIMSRVKKSSSNNGDNNLPLPASTGKDRVSLLASLPDDYLSASTTFKEQTKISS